MRNALNAEKEGNTLEIPCAILEPLARRRIAEAVLRDLPEWFGNESATRQYIQDAGGWPMFAVLEGETALGFLSLKQHNAFAVEIAVMGVRRDKHRAGVGRRLVCAAEKWAREQGAVYMTVKTLADTHPDPGYARTRLFYQAMGFLPLEIFPLHWDEQNPCVFLVKSINNTKEASI